MKRLHTSLVFVPLLILCFLSLPGITQSLSAQTGNIQLDSTRALYQPILQHLPPDAVFGDMMPGSAIFSAHRGDPAVDAPNDVLSFRQSLLTLKNSSVDYQRLVSLDSMERVVNSLRSSGTIPIGLIHYEYHGFTDSAFAWNEVVCDSVLEQIYFTGPPAFQTAKTSSSTVFGFIENNANPTFVLPSNLFFSNTGPVLNLRIDLGDGAGFRPLNFDQPIQASYPPQQGTELLLDIRLEYETMELEEGVPVYETYQQAMKLYKVEITPADKELLVNQSSEFQGISWCGMNLNDPAVVNEAKVHIRYGKGNTSGQFQKPFILVEGFDPPIEPYGAIQWSTFIAGLSYQNGKPSRQNLADLKVLADSLYENGYDAILVNYENGAGDMFKNGNTLIKVIQWVNHTKVTDEKLVVMGASMGGLLARYALRQMELMGCTHCTKLYGTFDSPHRGANIPLGLQYAIDFYRATGAIDNAQQAYELLGTPAAQQLVIHNIFPGAGAKRGQWMQWLDTNGHPRYPKRVSITNGDPGGADPFSEGDLLYDFNYKAGGANMAFVTLNGSKDGAMNFEGFHPKGSKGIWKWFRRVFRGNNGGYYKKIDSPANTEFYDHRTGSQANWIKELADAVEASSAINTSSSGFTTHKPRDLMTTFVPTFSALDMVGSPLNPNLSAMYDRSLGEHLRPDPANHPFDAIFFHSSTHPAKQGNQIHVLVDADPDQNIDWIMDQLRSVDGYAIPGGSLTQTYNLHGDVAQTTYLDPLFIDTGGKLHLNGDYQLFFGTPSDPWPTLVGVTYPYAVGVCGEGIRINGGGTLELGQDNRPFPANNKAELYVQQGSSIRIKSHGTLIIHEGSSLVIEDGARLVLEDQATIILAGDNAVMKVSGQIILENGADFTFSKGTASQAGYVHFFKTPTNSSEFIVPTGSGSRIDLEGNSYNSDNLIMVQDGAWKVPASIDELRLKSGMMRYANNGALDVHCALDAEAVKFEEVYANAVNTTGLILNGQANVRANLCIFKNLKNGMQVLNSASSPVPDIDNCNFLYCQTGLSYVGGTIEAQGLRASDCGVGLDIFVDHDSRLNRPYLSDNQSVGLRMGSMGSGAIHMYVEDATVKDNAGTGIETFSNADLSLSCGIFTDNGIAVDAEGALNLSTTTSLATYTGGTCRFEDNAQALQVSGELHLVNGKNTFINNGGAPYSFIAGQIPNGYLPASGNLPADDNYWYPVPAGGISGAGSSYYQITSLNGVNPHPYTVLLTGSMSSTANASCSASGGSQPGGGSQNATRSGEALNLDNSLHIAPNPLQGTGFLQLSLEIARAGSYTLQVVDMMGRKVYVSGLDLPEGTTRQRIDLSKLGSGTYVVSCFNPQLRLSKTFIKQ